MTVLRAPADRPDQFRPENVSKSEFLIVLGCKKWKFLRPPETIPSPNSRSLTKIARNPCKPSLSRKSAIWPIRTHFYSLFRVCLFSGGNAPWLLKSVNFSSLGYFEVPGGNLVWNATFATGSDRTLQKPSNTVQNGTFWSFPDHDPGKVTPRRPPCDTPCSQNRFLGSKRDFRVPDHGLLPDRNSPL